MKTVSEPQGPADRADDTFGHRVLAAHLGHETAAFLRAQRVETTGRFDSSTMRHDAMGYGQEPTTIRGSDIPASL